LIAAVSAAPVGSVDGVRTMVDATEPPPAGESSCLCPPEPAPQRRDAGTGVMARSRAPGPPARRSLPAEFCSGEICRRVRQTRNGATVRIRRHELARWGRSGVRVYTPRHRPPRQRRRS
jgi:hypothetical protein